MINMPLYTIYSLQSNDLLDWLLITILSSLENSHRLTCPCVTAPTRLQFALLRAHLHHARAKRRHSESGLQVPHNCDAHSGALLPHVLGALFYDGQGIPDAGFGRPLAYPLLRYRHRMQQEPWRLKMVRNEAEVTHPVNVGYAVCRCRLSRDTTHGLSSCSSLSFSASSSISLWGSRLAISTYMGTWINLECRPREPKRGSQDFPSLVSLRGRSLSRLNLRRVLTLDCQHLWEVHLQITIR